ncbi:hypothetical protein JCM8547_005222 [Rhodosporidiobolus lusitaniae]
MSSTLFTRSVSSRMAPKDGLVVTVSPSASAFFAGELFTATITLTNSFAPPPPQASSFAPQPYRSASGAAPSSWKTLTPQSSRIRPTNASHSNLADYAGSPSSPYSPAGYGQRTPTSAPASASTSQLPSPSSTPRRAPFDHVNTGNALPSPHSAALASPSSPSRPSPSPDRPLPTRKGLIGKPPAPDPPRAVGAALYAGGPRRPGGGLLRGHARTQSMAVSSTPDLLNRGGAGGGGEEGGMRYSSAPFPGQARGHGKNRFGGSVAGEAFGTNGFAAGQQNSPVGSPLRGLPARVDEEDDSDDQEAPAKPDFPDDAAFPFSESTSAPAPSHFPRRPTFGHRRISSNSPYGHNTRASLSTLSLASDGSESDDPDEHNRGPANSFYGVGRNDTMESIVEAGYHRAARDHAPPLNRFSSVPSPSPYAPSRPGHDRTRSISYGNGAPPPPASSSSSYPPNTLSLLWAFAHLEGAFEVDESLIKPHEFLEVKRLIAGGLAGVGVGGGTLEERREQGGWKGWLWGSRPKQEEEDERGAASLEERKERAVKDRAVPTFSCPPSILGVDLVLEPGQSKSFTFTIRIPADLPPSFRGKAIRFNYHLVVGTNRIPLGLAPHPAQVARYKRESVSRVMRVPVRVYNHVGVTGARPFYDLTNPIIFQRDEATAVDTENPKVPIRKIHRPDTGKQDFESYAANLLDSVVANSPEIIQNASLSPTLEQARSPTMMEAGPQLRPEMSSRAGGGGGQLGGPVEGFGLDLDEASGCKAAVEIVSRNSQKVSYDINKDGYQVASLTLVKSAYRLGETVNGSVVINSGEGRVLRVSARLETHELVETSIATMPAPRMRQITRRLHSEHHEMVLDSARVGFALAIPSGATPEFGTSGVKLQWSVRLSFLIIPPSPDASAGGAPPPPERRRGIGPFGGRPAAPPPQAPQNGSSSRHGRSKSFAYGFEPAVPLTLPPPPSIAPSGAAHLMPVLPRPGDPNPPQHVSYRAVPDLGFVPVPFSSAAPEPPPAPGPLQKAAAGAHHRTTPSVSLPPRSQSPLGNGSVVLVPAKVETVECSIPIKVFPSNTAFRPTITLFDA